TSIVHTKARVRRYQQLTYSIKTYSAHLPFLTYNLSSSFTHSIHVFLGFPFLTPPTTSKFLHLETQSPASLRSTCPNHLSLPRLTLAFDASSAPPPFPITSPK